MEGAQGWKGREKRGRRLADPVFKMAAKSMADFLEYQDFQNRPFHRAYLDGKLPCPHILCKSNCGKVFFEEQGIAQHFRIKHRGIVFDEEKQLRDARRMFRFSHGAETKR